MFKPTFLFSRQCLRLARGICTSHQRFLKAIDLNSWSTPLRTPLLHQKYCSFVTTDSAIQEFLDKLSASYAEGDGTFNNLNVVPLLEERVTLRKNLASLKELETAKSTSDELRDLINEEKDGYVKQLLDVEYKLLEALVPKPDGSDNGGIVIEITAGVGGQEAMLFAKDLYDMYSGYTAFKGWTGLTLDLDSTGLGGIRHASILIEDNEAYTYLQNESGVHRVQRVPLTEKSGRVHTSTVSVAVLPQPSEVDIQLNEKDLIIETKRASGAGGQHVNTTDSAVRLTHVPSGVVVECQTERSQFKNKEIAFKKLRSKLYQKQLEEDDKERRSMRKSQVGTKGRSEKVRTYNFNQDRITDHRLSKNYHNLPVFLKGGQVLDSLIKELSEQISSERLKEFIQEIKSGNVPPKPSDL